MLNQDFMIQALILTRQLLTVLFDLKKLGFRLESYQKKKKAIWCESKNLFLQNIHLGYFWSSNFVTGVKSQK